MSRYLTGFIVLLLLGTFQAFSQNNALFLRKNKFSLNIFSLIRRPVIVDEPAYYPVVFHGILYTRDLGKGYHVRARFDYFQRNRDRSTGTNMDANLYSDIQMGGGWLYAFGDGTLIPYLASDLMMTSVLRYSENGGVDAGTYRKIQLRGLGASLMPLAGVTWQVSPVLSFSLETNVELGYTREKGTDFSWGENKVPVEKEIRENTFFARWNPVSLLSVELSF